MLSHAIKKLLDEATGLKFSPVIGMSEQIPICSYNLSENSYETINQANLEVRIFDDDYDTIEELREKIKNNICSKENESGKVVNNYFLRIKPAGGGILRGDDYFDSTQFFYVTFYKKGE